MQTTPGRPRLRARLARALGLDRNPLRRASDRAEAWIRIALLAVFLIAGPIAALGAGGWAHHAGITATPVHAAPTHRVETVPLQAALVSTYPGRIARGSQAWSRLENAATSAGPDEVLAVLMTLALTALTLLAAQRLTRALLTRRRLADWETAWSRVGPQWSRGRP